MSSELPTTWFNIRGEELFIGEMGSDHILNCMRHIHSMGRSKGLTPLAAVGTFTKHPEAFRRQIRSREDVLVNVNRDRMVVI